MFFYFNSLMKKTRLPFIALSLLVFNSSLICQDLEEQKTKESLKKHISVLASDKFEGRETGSKGEQMTIDYISEQFKTLNLQPKGNEGYIQHFTFVDGIKNDPSATKFSVDNATLQLDEDYYPLPYSANGKVTGSTVYVKYGISDSKSGHDDYAALKDLKGKIFVMETSEPEKLSDFGDFRTKINTAIEKGAAAVIFVNTDPSAEIPKIKTHEYTKIAASSIPVITVTSDHSKKLSENAVKTVTIETSLTKTERKGQNVMAFLDNKAATTVVIGAHLDHLGFGDESSLHKGERAIHNGADDNASGTAGVLELAKYLKAFGPKNNNYFFICFSGEEKGLIGSGHYVKNPTIDLTKVNYMINMDMIGRLNNDEKTVSIYGTGTSPVWNDILKIADKGAFKVKTIESGVGPSDHTSFYLKDIPVLHFFSGFHSDYHKPGDDEEKINYEGEYSILKMITEIIKQADAKGKLSFTKTKEEVASKNTSKPRVSLGVIPDYNYSGDGMKIDGVTDGKPAASAGLKAGDVITQLGEKKIVDMESYMKALSSIGGVEETSVIVKRGNDLITLPISFRSAKPQNPGLSEKNYRVYSVKLGKEVPLDSIISDMKNYDVLFYGEEHNDSVTHYLEKTIFEKMYGRYGNKAALSMEMFDRDVQPIMNEYLKDFIREKNFKKDARVWGNYRDYRPMVELAKEKQLDVICANAAGRYSNLAGRKGQAALKALPAESKPFFAPLPYDTATGKYYDKLLEMSGHSPAQKNDTTKPKMPAMAMGGFSLITAQSLWDATMAYSISEYLKKNKDKKVMQVNGRFHSDEGFAVVTQLKKYNKKARILIISSGSDEAFPNIDWSQYKHLGDYVIITDPNVPRTYKE